MSARACHALLPPHPTLSLWRSSPAQRLHLKSAAGLFASHTHTHGAHLCREYQAFKVSADGELQGIGLLLANELTSTGHLRVLAPIKGGPADRAGILPGDEVRAPLLP